MQLEVGMNIYTKDYDSKMGNIVLRRCTISRVTAKLAMIVLGGYSGDYEIRFDREQKEQSFYEKNHAGDVWGHGRLYWLESPEIIAQYNRSQLEKKFFKIQLNALSNEQIEAILKTVSGV